MMPGLETSPLRFHCDGERIVEVVAGVDSVPTQSHSGVTSLATGNTISVRDSDVWHHIPEFAALV